MWANLAQTRDVKSNYVHSYNNYFSDTGLLKKSRLMFEFGLVNLVGPLNYNTTA